MKEKRKVYSMNDRCVYCSKPSYGQYHIECYREITYQLAIGRTIKESKKQLKVSLKKQWIDEKRKSELIYKGLI